MYSPAHFYYFYLFFPLHSASRTKSPTVILAAFKPLNITRLGVMEMQPLKVEARPTNITDAQKSMTQISNVQSNSKSYQDDQSTLRVRCGVNCSIVGRDKAKTLG